MPRPRRGRVQRWLRTLTTRPSGSRTKKRRTPHSSSRRRVDDLRAALPDGPVHGVHVVHLDADVGVRRSRFVAGHHADLRRRVGRGRRRHDPAVVHDLLEAQQAVELPVPFRVLRVEVGHDSADGHRRLPRFCRVHRAAVMERMRRTARRRMAALPRLAVPRSRRPETTPGARTVRAAAYAGRGARASSRPSPRGSAHSPAGTVVPYASVSRRTSSAGRMPTMTPATTGWPVDARNRRSRFRFRREFLSGRPPHGHACAVGRTTTSPTSTPAGCSIA